MKMFVAIYKSSGELCVVYDNIIFSFVEFEVDGKAFRYLMAELGGRSNFEIIGEL
jgi:hypothetical protein